MFVFTGNSEFDERQLTMQFAAFSLTGMVILGGIGFSHYAEYAEEQDKIFQPIADAYIEDLSRQIKSDFERGSSGFYIINADHDRVASSRIHMSEVQVNELTASMNGKFETCLDMAIADVQVDVMRHEAFQYPSFQEDGTHSVERMEVPNVMTIAFANTTVSNPPKIQSWAQTEEACQKWQTVFSAAL